MKKIGIIGGLAWPSTIDYYRLLCTRTNAHFRQQGVTPPYPTPHMIIESMNMNDTRSLRGKGGDEASWRGYDEVFRKTFERLRDAGADFGMIASNTPHMRLKAITGGLDFPVVSILDSTAAAVRACGGKRALVLGTPVTMKSDVYPGALADHGVEAMARLADEEIADMERLIDIDLYQGDIGDGRERILTLCRAHVKDADSDIVCLACTELPLAFPEHQDSAVFKAEGICFVNTTVAHVEAALREALA